MALNTLQGLYGTRSPIYITWSESSVTTINSVELEVYIWTGSKASRPASPHITINRTTGFGSNTTHTTDISSLIADQININIAKLFNNNILSEQNGRVAWVQIDYDVTYNTSTNDTGSSDIFQVIEGYSYFDEGANYAYTQTILSPTSDQNTYEYNVEMMPIYVGEYGEGLDIVYSYEDRVLADGGTIESLQCANIGWKTMRILLDDGTKYDYAVPETVVYTGDQAEDRIKLFPSGMANLKNWLLNQGSSLDIINSAWYKLQLLDTFENIIDERKFIPTCEIKYDPVQLAYISRYGTWNYATFFKRSEETIDVTKEEYRTITGNVQDGAYRYGLHNPVYKKYNTNGKRRLTINSGFVDEAFKEVMEQMMLSEYVLVVTQEASTVVKSGSSYTYTANNGSVAVNVATSSLTKQKEVNEKLINYTLDIEYAFDELNTTL
jgi:hypothetical protein